MARHIYGKIVEVEEGSPAWRAGIQRGDELLSINAQPVHDILEYRYLSAEERLEVQIRRAGRTRALTVLKDAAEDFGLRFEEELFDGLRRCENDCIFCFLHQMPKGFRQSLYVRDDDYRLSFAHGNYVTLTNFGDEDMERIHSQRMSPIYVSVHATEPDLRTRMFRNEKAGRIMEQLRKLADGRIKMHTQIVLCPGINDGEHLERSIRDLSLLHPWVASVAVVPVGLTKHRAGLTPLKPVDRDLARWVIDSCRRWQREFKQRLGTRLVFPSDELYLLSETRFPGAAAYEGFLQLEDGVGICRLFLDELGKVSRRASGTGLRGGRYVLVTGVLAAPLVQQLADTLSRFDRMHARVCPVKNKFLGETVTVAGLLAGRDIAAALQGAGRDERVLIPRVALNEDRLLDDVTVSELQEMVGREVIAVPATPRGMIECLADREASVMNEVSCAGGAGMLSRE